MAQIWSLASLVIAILLAGCAFENQFRNVRTGSPHAVLVGDGVTLFHINDQPTGFWRSRERFRIPVGPTTVNVISGSRRPVQHPLLRFSAEAGHTYTAQLQQVGDSDRIVLRDGGKHADEQNKIIP